MFGQGAAQGGAVGGRSRRLRWSVVLVGIGLTIAATACTTGPTQPAVGLGAEGACGQTSTSFGNPSFSGQTVWVFQPTGVWPTPITGGSCGDAKRPVVFFSHGQSAGDPSFYSELITHIVSTGNIVVFASHPADLLNLVANNQTVEAGDVAAVAATPRADVSRVGFVGHSVGGGMVPYLVQRAPNHGWGGTSLWMYALAMYYVGGVGTGPITVPANTRAIVENFDNDGTVDNRIGVEAFGALALPAAQKQHVTLRSETRDLTTLNASHNTPLSGLLAPDDALHFFGLFRNVDALESCSLSGANCTTDLTFMGLWSDLAPVTPAVSTDTPADIGPSALIECEGPLFPNPRSANCGTTHH